jgi:hypothetical protein
MLAALGLAGLVFGCGGDDDGGSTDTPTGTTSPRTRTPARTSSSASPTDDDLKSPPPDETANSGSPGITPTIPPTASTGKRAPRVQDVSAFFAQFPSAPQDERQCVYNPSTRLIDCSDRAQYAPDPPAVGQGIECFLMASGGSPVVVRCEIADPQGTAYYDVR